MINCDKPCCGNWARHFYKLDSPAFDILVEGKWTKPKKSFYARCTYHRLQGITPPYGTWIQYWDENSSEEEYVVHEIMQS
jgi:hypothetical protein